MRHVVPGHVPRYFCNVACVRAYLASPGADGIDRRTLSELESLLRRAERREALATEWEQTAERDSIRAEGLRFAAAALRNSTEY